MHCATAIFIDREYGDIMNYSEAREYLRQVRGYGSHPGLEVIKELLKRLGDPQDDLKIVHICGTNGKGSTIAFLESILLKAGYSVGKFCSPAVFKYREIIRFNDEYISKDDMAEILTEIKAVCDEMKKDFRHPTIFEVETAMALLYFKKKSPDMVLLECGMGGLEDATNVTKTALLNIFTTISMDHMNFLGDTLEKIAKTKAGIIKNKANVVVANQSEAVIDIIKNEAKLKDARVTVAGKPRNISVMGYKTKYEYQSSNGRNFKVVLNAMGTYQITNSILAIEAAIALENNGFKLRDYIEEGLLNAVWNGRLEIVNRNPLVVIDGAHNEDAVVELKKSLDSYFTNKRITFIMGVLADKDIVRFTASLLSRAIKVICVTPNNERGLAGWKLAEMVKAHNENVEAAPTFESAIRSAYETVYNDESDMIIAFGSLSYLNDIKTEVKCIESAKRD